MTKDDLRKLASEARPILEKQRDLKEQLTVIRDAASSRGIDWSQLKAVLNASIADETDGEGEKSRVARLVEKAEFACAYADMLGFVHKDERTKNPVVHLPEQNSTGSGKASGGEPAAGPGQGQSAAGSTDYNEIPPMLRRVV